MAVLWVLLAALCLGEAASVGGKSETYDTIIVGMGAAGTAAASNLAKAGKRVLGLEAQGRVGGRVNTVACGDGVVELGAEWIHGIEGSPTYKLAVDHNITILNQHTLELVAWSDGSLPNMNVIGQLLTVVMESEAGGSDEPQPVGVFVTQKIMDFLNQNNPDLAKDPEFLSAFLLFADLIVDSITGSDNWNESCTVGSYETLGGSQDMSWHRHGYRTLFNVLLNKYNDGPGLPTLTVKLNTEVTQIVWPQQPEEKVVVKTKDGGEYTADNVIVTVSVGVLKERHNALFSPSLPPTKVTAIESISIGVVDKIVLIFPDSWWPKDIGVGFLWRAKDLRSVPEGDEWVTKIAGVSTPMGCDKALTLWTNGEAARHIETLSEEVVKIKSMELLRKFLGSNYTITEPTAIYRTTWYSNPFTRGSYSFESMLTPQHPTARQDLAEPLRDSSGEPRLLFAGEASHPTHFSTVHGAVGTGFREAARILHTEDPAAKLTSQRGRMRRGIRFGSR